MSKKNKSESNKKSSKKTLVEIPHLTTAIANLIKEIVQKNEEAEYNSEDPFSTENGSSVDIEYYYERIKKYTELEDSTLIISLIFSDRLCAKSGLILESHNVHRIILACVLIAIKYNEDCFYDNSYYAQVGGVTLKEINLLEYYCIEMLDFDLYINRDIFYKYVNCLEKYIFDKKN